MGLDQSFRILDKRLGGAGGTIHHLGPISVSGHGVSLQHSHAHKSVKTRLDGCAREPEGEGERLGVSLPLFDVAQKPINFRGRECRQDLPGIGLQREGASDSGDLRFVRAASSLVRGEGSLASSEFQELENHLQCFRKSGIQVPISILKDLEISSSPHTGDEENMARRTGLGRKPSRICGRLGVAVALWGALCLVLPLAAGLVPRGGALQADDVGVESGVNRGVQGRTAAPTWATDGSEPSESVLRGEGHFTEHVNAPEGAPLYFARSRGLLPGFLESQVIVDLREPEEAGPGGSGTAGEEPERHVIARLTFPGSNPVPPRASDELPFSTSFFVGQDSKEWRTGLRSFSGLVYEDLYGNIDLVVKFEYHMKYEFLC